MFLHFHKIDSKSQSVYIKFSHFNDLLKWKGTNQMFKGLLYIELGFIVVLKKLYMLRENDYMKIFNIRINKVFIALINYEL